MKRIQCLIIDDEPPAQDALKTYISSVSFLDLVGMASSAVEAMAFLQNQPIDLMFVDIQMPGLLGTDFIKTIKSPPSAIFTTAHKEFAIEGFELNALDYLLKPISFDRFLKAVNKMTDHNHSNVTDSPLIDHTPVPPKTFITVRADRKNLKLPLDSILFIESMRDYVRIVTDSKEVVCKQPLSALESTLPREKFIRIHRSYIVAIDRIETYTHELIGMGKHELPVSRLYRLEVQKVLGM